MRDGGIDFGSSAATGKKKDEPVKKGKKDEKESKAPVKEEAKMKAKGNDAAKEPPKAIIKPEAEIPAAVSQPSAIPTFKRADSPVKDYHRKDRQDTSERIAGQSRTQVETAGDAQSKRSFKFTDEIRRTGCYGSYDGNGYGSRSRHGRRSR